MFSSEKTRMLGYHTLKKIWWYVKPFRYSTAVCQTDRQTELLYQYCMSALLCSHTIKTVRISQLVHQEFSAASMLVALLKMWQHSSQCASNKCKFEHTDVNAYSNAN